MNKAALDPVDKLTFARESYVRRAVEDDSPWILEELKAFSAFYGTKKSLFPENIDDAESVLLMLINRHVFFVAEIEGKPAGFIAGFVTPHVFNPAIKILAETFWWVIPEYRNSRAGLLLLREFTAWGLSNADWITMTLEHHSPVNPKALLKRGYKLQETSFLMETN